MITVFHVLNWSGLVFGAATGLVFGARLGGVIGGFIGVVCGTVIGGVIGRLPYDLTRVLIQRGSKRSSDRELNDRIT